MNDYDASKLLIRLKGRKLSSIEFVMDYQQLLFDGIGVTVNNPITIIVGDNAIEQSNSDFNNCLINIIGNVIKDALFWDDKYVELIFENHVIIRISLNPLDYTSPEGVIFEDSINRITSVW